MPGPGSSSSAAARSSGVSDPLERLRRGEITLDAYLDFRAEEGVKGLAGLFPVEKVGMIREVLREQLANDPTLVASVERLLKSEQG